MAGSICPMTSTQNSMSVSRSKAISPPPLPPALLSYTFLGNVFPVRPFKVRLGFFFAGLLAAAVTSALAILVAYFLGRGWSIASLLARVAALAIACAPLLAGRLVERRLQSTAPA